MTEPIFHDDFMIGMSLFHSGITLLYFLSEPVISFLCHPSLQFFLFLEVEDPGHVSFPSVTSLVADCPSSSLGRQPCMVLWHHVGAETFWKLCAFWIPHMSLLSCDFL